MANAGKFSELKQRLLFVIGALIVFRIGTFIPVPGIDPTVLSSLFDQQKGSILGVFNMFSGDYHAVISGNRAITGAA